MNKSYFKFEASKTIIGILIGVGSIYPLGAYWSVGFIIGAVIFGWGWKESSDLMKVRAPVPNHKIAGPILLILIVANLVKLIV